MGEKMTLLPCPFCGSADILEGEVLSEHPDGRTTKQNQCGGCGTLGPEAEVSGPDYGDVLSNAAWNRRHLTQPAQAVDVTDADVEAAGAAYFEQQWDMLPPRSKAIYRNALRRALKSFATRALSAEKAGWRDEKWMLECDGHKTYWPSAEIAERERANLAILGHRATVTPPLPASPTPDKEGCDER